jgi:pyruvate ferredoxin oxidoreductase delta subunit
MDEVKRQKEAPSWKELALGSAVIYAGSARALRTGDWRSSRPVWRYVGESTGCVQCALCTVYCPEGCIHVVRFEETGSDASQLRKRPAALITEASLVPAADLDYCKGCGICARECPTRCIEMVEEEV